MKKQLLIVLLFALSSFVFPQKSNPLKPTEDSLCGLLKKIHHGAEDFIRFNANENFTRILLATLVKPESFEYPFDSLREMFKEYAPDKKFRIYNWHIPLSNGTFEYRGIIQIKDLKTKKLSLYILSDKTSEIANPELAALSTDKWYGALYYKIIYNRKKGKDYYTLLGWKGNNTLTTKKLIEVLSFNSKGKPVFGLGVFKTKVKKPFKRIIFEYSAQVVMSLKYEEDQDLIIYDHLSPPEPQLEGQYQFYGPDFSTDALELKNKRWELIENFEARNPRDKLREKRDYGLTKPKSDKLVPDKKKK